MHCVKHIQLRMCFALYFNYQKTKRNDVITMTTKFDAFDNEYIVVESNDFIETTIAIVRHYVARSTYIANNRQFERSMNNASKTIAHNIFAFTHKHECKRYYIDDLRDDVFTFFYVD